MPDKPNLLLTSTAAIYFVISVALIFASDELLSVLSTQRTKLELVLLQLLGAAVFSLAMLNWMNRFSRIGGIFGRPLVVTNLANSTIAALTLVHFVRRFGASTSLVVGLGLYAIIALAFGITLFRGPRLDDGASKRA